MFVVLGVLVVVLFWLNWRLSWSRNDTDVDRGLQRWQGWDDGHGGGL